MIGQHITPCAQCPWRKTSPAGWLGNSTPLEFLAQAESEIRMPCHCAVDYDREDWPQQAEVAPRCAGHAAYLRNRCKMPRDPQLREFTEQVGQHPGIFNQPAAFVAHHGGDVSRVMGVILGFDNGEDIHK